MICRDMIKIKAATNAFLMQLICEIWNKSVNKDFRARNSPVFRRLIEILIACPSALSAWSCVDNRSLNSLIDLNHLVFYKTRKIYLSKPQSIVETHSFISHASLLSRIYIFNRSTNVIALFVRNKHVSSQWQIIEPIVYIFVLCILVR